MKIIQLAIAAVLVVMLGACAYDPPPDFIETNPEASSIASPETVISVTFSEPIDIRTLEMALWYQVDRLFDEDGQLLPQCTTSVGQNCSRMWFGPVAMEQATLSFATEPCMCRASQSYNGSRLVLEQDCRSFATYGDWDCNGYFVGGKLQCQEFTNGVDNPCLAKMAGVETYSVRSLDRDENPARLLVDPARDLDIGAYLLRLTPGLADLQGNKTGVPLDLPFSVSPGGEGGPTTFEGGTFLTWMDLTEPLAYPMEVVWHIEADPDTGRLTGSGCDADPVDTSVQHTDHTASNWYPWPFTYDEGYNFTVSGLVQDIEVDGKQGYSVVSDPLRIYAGPPIEVEVLDGVVDLRLFNNEEIDRLEITGLLTSPELYIFSSKESGGKPEKAEGVVYGYQLKEDEVAAFEKDHAEAWQYCLEPDEDARPTQ